VIVPDSSVLIAALFVSVKNITAVAFRAIPTSRSGGWT